MLTEKPWRAEAVLRLAAGIGASLFLGLALVNAIQTYLPSLPKRDRDFYGFLIGALCFQGAAIGLIHLFLRQHNVGWRAAFGIGLADWRHGLKRVGVALLFILPTVVALGEAAQLVLQLLGYPLQPQVAVKLLANKPPPLQLIGYGLVAMVLAPIAEELLFRGILYPTLKQSGHPALALWATSLLFATTHLNLLAFLPLTFLALVLAWLYERTGNILAPILAHVAFNTINFALIVMFPNLVKG